jgi:hypothetical protein
MNKYIRIWVTIKRMTYKIRSERSPLREDYEIGLRIGGLAGFWIEFWNLEFWRNFSRRGTHVNPLKIGSRVVHLLHWRNLRICAELRRDWGGGVLF